MEYLGCKEIAQKCASEIGVEINKAEELPTAYVFDNKDVEYMGILPIVVDKENGQTSNLWRYINQNNYTMDDLKEIDF